MPQRYTSSMGNTANQIREHQRPYINYYMELGVNARYLVHEAVPGMSWVLFGFILRVRDGNASVVIYESDADGYTNERWLLGDSGLAGEPTTQIYCPRGIVSAQVNMQVVIERQGGAGGFCVLSYGLEPGTDATYEAITVPLVQP